MLAQLNTKRRQHQDKTNKIYPNATKAKRPPIKVLSCKIKRRAQVVIIRPLFSSLLPVDAPHAVSYGTLHRPDTGDSRPYRRPCTP